MQQFVIEPELAGLLGNQAGQESTFEQVLLVRRAREIEQWLAELTAHEFNKLVAQAAGCEDNETVMARRRYYDDRPDIFPFRLMHCFGLKSWKDSAALTGCKGICANISA